MHVDLLKLTFVQAYGRLLELLENAAQYIE
jgi:hypothetical protein